MRHRSGRSRVGLASEELEFVEYVACRLVTISAILLEATPDDAAEVAGKICPDLPYRLRFILENGGHQS
ncbi:MAG: hypothetical protein ABFS37_06475, partial [Acidobacteriota bacterium]